MNAYLPDVLAKAHATRDAAVRDFASLDAVAMNWKPSADAWSVAQCLDHLRISTLLYVAMFEDVAAANRRPSLVERLPLLPRLFGPALRWATSPDTTTRAKTSAALVPASSALPPTVLSDFAHVVDALVASIAAIRNLDHRSVVVTSPFAGFITYTLEDAVRISVDHLERHRRQAKRVTQQPGFPLPAD